MSIDSHLLEIGAREFGLNLTPQQLTQFSRLAELLALKNQEFNLTSLAPEDFVVKHILDSLSVLGLSNTEWQGKLIDVGTGAGFPGLPLAIACPDLQITLLDGTEKRLKFIEQVIIELQIPNAKTLHGRAELIGREPEHRECYDFAIARAVANLTSLSELCLPLVRVAGRFIAMKSAQATFELDQAAAALSQLGARLIDEQHLVLPGSDFGRILLVFEKIAATSERFPRSSKKILEKPLA